MQSRTGHNLKLLSNLHPGAAVSRARLLCSCFMLLLLSGCASYGVIHNKPITDAPPGKPYGIKTWAESTEVQDFVFILNFSGGGTRAAAMAYGVLEGLRDTQVTLDGQQKRLLDEVTHISSVSGGSFASAYYGLYGDKIFEDFKNDFLLKDVQGALTRSLLNPFHWFGSKGRTERSAEYYNKILFHDATFGDMMHPGRPMIIINASDLAYGVRFSFVQDYFNLLCSDLKEYPVAWAVTASSAVPVVFNPIVLQNYPGCPERQVSAQALENAKNSLQLTELLAGLETYKDKENRKYIHFVDGGITDNMGLRAMVDVVAASGGPQEFMKKVGRKIPKHIVFLTVNASTEKDSEMNLTAKQPSMLASMNAMTDIQLHRYNSATIDQTRFLLKKWAADISTPEQQVKSYFIEIGFKQVADPQLKYFLNKVPTAFSLTPEQVDALINSGKEILLADPEFQQLLAELAANP